MRKTKEFEITQEQYEQNLREGADPEHAPKPGRYVGRRGTFLERHPELKRKKTRVNIHLDDDVIEYFKRLAAQPDAAPYQTQINNALRRVMQGDGVVSKGALLKDRAFIKQVAAAVKRLSKQS